MDRPSVAVVQTDRSGQSAQSLLKLTVGVALMGRVCPPGQLRVPAIMRKCSREIMGLFAAKLARLFRILTACPGLNKRVWVGGTVFPAWPGR
jgi:hypothetical protein